MDDPIKILAILPSSIPSTVLYVIKPMLLMQKEHKVQFKMSFGRICKLDHIDWADLVVFCRNIAPAYLRFLYYAVSKNKKIIYQLDDNFFEFNMQQHLVDKLRHPCVIWALKEFLTYADLVRVYSDPLYERVEKINPHVKNTKAYFDFSLIEGMKNRRRNDGKVQITYATGRGADDTAKLMIDQAIFSIADKYRDLVEFNIFGVSLSEKRPNIHYYPYIASYDSYIKKFYRSGCDIGLAPMYDDVFHRSKTNTKYREYGGCGIAGIYSRVSVYSECVRDGVNGLLVDNTPGSWIDAIERLILDPKLRSEIQANAYKDVRSQYSFEAFNEDLYNDIVRVMNEKSDRPLLSGNGFQKKVLAVTEYDIGEQERSMALSEVLEHYISDYRIVTLDEATRCDMSDYDVIIFLLSRVDTNKVSRIETILKANGGEGGLAVIDVSAIGKDDVKTLEKIGADVIICLPKSTTVTGHQVYVIPTKAKGGKYNDISQYEPWIEILKNAKARPHKKVAAKVFGIGLLIKGKIFWFFQKIARI